MSEGILHPTGARALPPHPSLYERIYVWQFPIRLYHWVNALAIAVLFATGLYIAHPILTSSGEPYDVFVMARVRQVHFAAAFVFLIAFLWRCAWFVMGNRFARSGFPYVWRPSWWRNLFRQASAYLKLDFGHPHLGHNSLAGLSYTIFVVGLGLAQILTGFALYSESNPGGILDRIFGWVIPLLGGSFQTHMWHHLFAWGFLFFFILHLYIVMLDARQYRNGLLVSMITGFKFRRMEERERVSPEDRDAQRAPLLVLGLGNPLLRDDGAGLALLRGLHATHGADPRLELLDGGTQGIALVEHLAGRRALLVLDAIALGARPGTVHCLHEPLAHAGPRSRSAHEGNAAELLAVARLLDGLPERLLLLGIEPAEVRTGVGLSGSVRAALPDALALARRWIAEVLERCRAEGSPCTS